MASLCFTPITAVEAREVLNWRYPGLPTLYNPAPDELEDDIEVLLTPAYNYYAPRGRGAVGGVLLLRRRRPGAGRRLQPAQRSGCGVGDEPGAGGTRALARFLAAILDWGR